MGMRLFLGLAQATVFTALLCGSVDAARADGTTARVDVPIGQMVLPNGDTRYFVPVSIGGGERIKASLDTGSFGVRVLARALSSSHYESTSMERRYGFGGGAQFNGVLAKGEIAVGDARTGSPVLFQLIKSVDCLPEMPKCPASRVDPAEYRIAGDGYAGLGFDAIIGLSLRKAPGGMGADNPLGDIGDGRWIVILPRPGESAPGHLIVNPGETEVAGFTLFHLQPQPSNGGSGAGLPGWKDAALPGCLLNDQSRERICGPTLFDSGAPGFSVSSSHVSSSTTWPAGTSATLVLDGGDQSVEIPFHIGSDISTRVRLISNQKGGERLSAGSLPYFSYAVLYDQKNGLMGVKPRDDR